MLEAVIFDMDGVIVNTEPGYFYALQVYLARFGYEITKEFNDKLRGVSYHDIYEDIRTGFALGDLAEEEFLIDIEKIRKDKIAIEGYEQVPGTVELMKELYAEGIIVSIASSSPIEDIHTVMQALQIEEYVKDIVSATDECTKGKPDPEIFIKMTEKLAVDPKNCIVVEDAIYGIRGAKELGMKTIGYEDDFGIQNLGEADLVVKNMEDVTAEVCRRLMEEEGGR